MRDGDEEDLCIYRVGTGDEKLDVKPLWHSVIDKQSCQIARSLETSYPKYQYSTDTTQYSAHWKYNRYNRELGRYKTNCGGVGKRSGLPALQHVGRWQRRQASVESITSLQGCEVFVFPTPPTILVKNTAATIRPLRTTLYIFHLLPPPLSLCLPVVLLPS